MEYGSWEEGCDAHVPRCARPTSRRTVRSHFRLPSPPPLDRPFHFLNMRPPRLPHGMHRGSVLPRLCAAGLPASIPGRNALHDDGVAILAKCLAPLDLRSAELEPSCTLIPSDALLLAWQAGSGARDKGGAVPAGNAGLAGVCSGVGSDEVAEIGKRMSDGGLLERYHGRRLHTREKEESEIPSPNRECQSHAAPSCGRPDCRPCSRRGQTSIGPAVACRAGQKTRPCRRSAGFDRPACACRHLPPRLDRR